MRNCQEHSQVSHVTIINSFWYFACCNINARITQLTRELPYHNLWGEKALQFALKLMIYLINSNFTGDYENYHRINDHQVLDILQPPMLLMTKSMAMTMKVSQMMKTVLVKRSKTKKN